MQIWNMKMKMGVIKVIYEAPQGHLWRRHDSLVSFMYGRPSLPWRASLPGAAVSLQGRAKVTYRVRERATATRHRLLCARWFILLIKMCDRPVFYRSFSRFLSPLRVCAGVKSVLVLWRCVWIRLNVLRARGIRPLKDATVFHCGANNKIISHVHHTAFFCPRLYRCARWTYLCAFRLLYSFISLFMIG